jgi:putative heme-binding domain-containing protein
MRTLFGCSLFASLLLPLLAHCENPQWIWRDGTKIRPDEVCYLRKTFSLDSMPTKASLKVAGDDEAVVFLNGKEVLKTTGTASAAHQDVVGNLHKGENVLAIRAHNVASDVAGVIAILETTTRKQPSKFVVTDASWRSSAKPIGEWQNAKADVTDWSHARVVGKLGDKPWGDVFQVPQATAASSLTVLPGFKVELVHSSEIGEGSWICMTKDGKGRLIISPQADDQPLLRVTVNGSKVKKIEKIAAPIHQAMGLLWAYDSLYVTGHGPSGTGLYRLVDANHNDRFETNELHFLSKIAGEGEHGYHALGLGPDKMIYLMDGNHTKLPPVIDPASPHKNYEEELLLPRQWDANGHAVGILAPGGHVLRTDEDGKKWTLMLAGFRNSYDFDFNSDGEMFTFDSDMEWDWGLPWYRPTRVNHCVTGAEFGWRSGSAVWPEYYADSLPATVNMGVGCPTGVKFGKGKNFPPDYRNALYLLDWSYGRIFAVHLRPQGASYTADFDVFVKGKPLNLTSLQFAKDGSMYFITGGRGTQSGLYHVTYTGKGAPPEQPKVSKREEKKAAAARAIRHKLESFYSKKDPAAINFAWPYLGSDDRFLSFAARVAIESQDVALWKERALAEKVPDAALNALLGLARCTGKATQRDLLLALKKFPMDSLSVTQKLDKLRVIELSFIRQGKPDADLAKVAVEKLDRLYPSDNEYLNRELSQLLIYLEAPDVVTKTLALLDRARTQEEQVHYIFYLRTLKTGWTLDQRKHYFDWFRAGENKTANEASSDRTAVAKRPPQHPAQLMEWFKAAGRDYADGVSYPKYLVNIRKDAIDSLSEQEHIALSTWIDDYNTAKAFKPSKERSFVQDWKLADLEPFLDQTAKGRNFKNGKAAFNDAQCMLCHRFGNEGGYIGPELTAAASKYAPRDILESILDPSKVVSDQFQNVMIIKKDGDAETGRLIDEDDTKVVMQPNPLSPERIPIQKTEIAERRPSHVSPMPEGLLNQFTKEEILDMLAYIESMGKEKAANFKPAEQAKH